MGSADVHQHGCMSGWRLWWVGGTWGCQSPQKTMRVMAVRQQGDQDKQHPCAFSGLWGLPEVLPQLTGKYNLMSKTLLVGSSGHWKNKAVSQMWDAAMAKVISGGAEGEGEATEAISPRKSAGWCLTCLLEEAAVLILPELSTERHDYHTTHQQPHHSELRGGLFPKSVTQYYAMYKVSVVLMASFVLFLRKFGLRSPEHLQPWGSTNLCHAPAVCTNVIPPKTLIPPQNVILAAWDPTAPKELASFHKCYEPCKQCRLLAFLSPARRAILIYYYYYYLSFCSIKSPNMSDLFSMQIVFAQLGKYWTSKFFLVNKFPLKSMRQASHLFLWSFVIY